MKIENMGQKKMLWTTRQIWKNKTKTFRIQKYSHWDLNYLSKLEAAEERISKLEFKSKKIKENEVQKGK